MNSYDSSGSVAAFDISIEAYAAALIENDLAIKGIRQVMVRPRGHVNRQNGNEVVGTGGSVFNKDGDELFYIDVNREGLFDSIPDMLFFKEKEFEDDLERAEYLTRQQEMARMFFLPFEEVLYHSRIKVEQRERENLLEVGDFLSKLYDLDCELDSAQGDLLPFALISPFLSDIVGDLLLTEGVLKFILKKNISVVVGKHESLSIPPSKQGSLGVSLLGMGLVTGSTFRDCIPKVQIGIPLQPDEVETWLGGSINRRFLDNVIVPHFFPAGQDVEIVLNVIQIPHQTQIGIEADNVCNVLGFTTLI
jgi:type VI secretion system protein ImpH